MRVNTSVKNDLKKFGFGEWNECFHCGNCTATCPLTENDYLFPRKSIRALQMGLKQKLMTNVDPWLCYYCGDCSETCPRDANPGELMMSLRRYLTSLYDWTGLARLFYMNKFWELIFILALAVGVVVAFLFASPPVNLQVNADGGVMLNQFAPVKWIELGDWIMAIIVAALLISNILNMAYRTLWSDKTLRVPFTAYFTEAYNLVVHFTTQAKFRKCNKNKGYWLGHWLIMTGYTIMFILIVVFLPWFQTETIHPAYHPQRLLGYYATFGLLFGLSYAMIGRLRRKEEKFKFSHFSDWVFLIMLFLTTLTGILVHFFRISGWAYATYFTYVAHLAILVPMILIEVPFSKWSHLAYRPFAIYFANIRKVALRRQEKTIENLAIA